MRIALGIFFLFTMPAGASFNYTGDLSLGSYFQSNIFYASENAESGMLTKIEPKVKLEYVGRSFYTDLGLDLSHQNFASFASASRTDYQVDAGFGFGSKDQSIHKINLWSGSQPNPLFSADADKAPIFGKTGASLEAGFSISKKSQFLLRIEFENQSVDKADFEYLNSNYQYSELSYSYRFLPETKFFLNIGAGTRVYKTGTKFFDLDANDTRRMEDSDIGILSAAIKGRLTKYTSIDAGFGLKSMKYKASKSFAEPVFHVKFTDQISPKDALIAGYTYRATDSSYTNWALEQDMNIAYSRIMNDTFLFLMRFSYVYYSYSEPFRREDQRMLARFRMDYVFAPNWTLVSNLNLDLLVSDAYDSNIASLDRPASYTNSDLGISVKRSF